MTATMLSSLTITAQAGAVADTTWGTDYATATSFTIEDMGDMLQFKALMDSGKTFEGKTVKLSDSFNNAADPLTTSLTTPDESIFEGVFDGNGKTVNLAINSGYGLFSNCYGCEIKNVTVDGYVNNFKTGLYQVGGIVGHLQNGKIENCVNKATIYGKFEVGGICGYVAYLSYLKDCINKGNVIGNDSSQYTIGGIAGEFYYRSKGEDGCLNQGTVTNNYYPNYYTISEIGPMGYVSKKGSCDVTALVNNEWIQTAYENSGITWWYTNNSLDFDMTPEFVNDGKVVKLTLTITNNTTSDQTETACLCADTMIAHNDMSDNIVEDDVLKMTTMGVTFFAFTDDGNDFVLVNTNYDSYDEAASPREVVYDNTRCDSAFVAYWDNEITIKPGESAKRYMYVGIAKPEEVNDIVATTLGSPEPEFTNSKDSGYYADTKNADDKEGIIAFTSAFTNLTDFNIASGDKFGMIVYTDNESQNINLNATDYDTLTANDGYFYSFVTDIAPENFEKTAIAKPYAVIGGKTYWGSAMEMATNGTKWLGKITNKPISE